MQNTMTMRGLFSRPKKERKESEDISREARNGAGVVSKRSTDMTAKADNSHETGSSAVKDRISLLDAEIGRTYIIKKIDTTDEEMNAFLFRLGCYSGEPITVISKKKKSCIVAIKDSRYGLDNQLAEAVIV